MLRQDLHIHTTFSKGDSAVVAPMSVELVAWANHAKVRGISDHFEYLKDENFEPYEREVRKHGFYLGTEVNDYEDAKIAKEYPFDYYIYHCRDRESEYKGLELLLATGKQVIISHPIFIGVDPAKLPPEVFIELNNRYIWRFDFTPFYTAIKDRFRFVIGSDAHQPNWLNQAIARRAQEELQIEETLLFQERACEKNL